MRTTSPDCSPTFRHKASCPDTSPYLSKRSTRAQSSHKQDACKRNRWAADTSARRMPNCFPDSRRWEHTGRAQFRLHSENTGCHCGNVRISGRADFGSQMARQWFRRFARTTDSRPDRMSPARREPSDRPAHRASDTRHYRQASSGRPRELARWNPSASAVAAPLAPEPAARAHTSAAVASHSRQEQTQQKRKRNPKANVT